MPAGKLHIPWAAHFSPVNPAHLWSVGTDQHAPNGTVTGVEASLGGWGVEGMKAESKCTTFARQTLETYYNLLWKIQLSLTLTVFCSSTYSSYTNETATSQEQKHFLCSLGLSLQMKTNAHFFFSLSHTLFGCKKKSHYWNN